MEMSLIEIKKLFAKHSSINFLNDFTLQDIDDAKKRCYMIMIRDKPNDSVKLQAFLDMASKKIMEDKYRLGPDNSIGVTINLLDVASSK